MLPTSFCYSQMDILFECLCCRCSTFADNIRYFAISIWRTLVFISAVAWISLSFFSTGHILAVSVYDLQYIVHTAIANFDRSCIKSRTFENIYPVIWRMFWQQWNQIYQILNHLQICSSLLTKLITSMKWNHKTMKS